MFSKYPTFYYHNYQYSYEKNYLQVEFKFEIAGLETFTPKWKFPCRRKINPSILEPLIFNLGLAELISYWKLTCSPVVKIECGYLSTGQKQWWKHLYKFGLGEFYYQNKLDIDDFAMDIETIAKPKTKVSPKLNDKSTKLLIPVGGGKDSIVTLELLSEYKAKIVPFLIGGRQASVETVKTAGYNHYAETFRTLDPKLITLNKQGFLNGHTPFSAIVAFSALIQSVISNCQYIILSNESSANEETVTTKKGHKINHQYSKSIEFENNFRDYVKKYLPVKNKNYFSLLRPLNELQIANIFIHRAQKYWQVFRSCNVGLKQNKWCCNCAKCLFVYIILSPFLGTSELIKIFGQNLLEKKELIKIRQQLQGITKAKPFECVGTKSEVNMALKGIYNPFNKDLIKALSLFDKQHNVPKKFLRSISQEVLVWGKGLEGVATKKLLPKATITEDNSYVKKHYNQYLTIYKSPGISLHQLGLANNELLLKKITSETNEFLRLYSAQTIGITGTKGKSTTSSLIYEILKTWLGRRTVLLVGNIGVPAFSVINQVKKATIIVYEMSSHQLERVTFSPHIAVLLNLSEDHLPYHGSVQKYHKAKLNIHKWQSGDDIFINKAPVEPWMKSLKRNILGEHNLQNIAFAYQVVKNYGITKAQFIKSVSNFKPLEHRLEYFASKNGVDFYNDSIATIPDATINAVETLLSSKKYNHIHLIIGGFDRKINYEKLQTFLNQQTNVKTVVIDSAAGKRIATKLKNFSTASSLAEATTLTFKNAETNDAVLLSPAASSFDAFKDYKDRGNTFKKLVTALP